MLRIKNQESNNKSLKMRYTYLSLDNPFFFVSFSFSSALFFFLFFFVEFFSLLFFLFLFLLFFFFFFESNEKISNSRKLNMVVRNMKRWKKTNKNLENGTMEIEYKANRH